MKTEKITRMPTAEVEELWKEYRQSGRSPAIRNRLAEHYFHWARRKASDIAGRMPLEDRPNAIDDAILALVSKAISSFDGRNSFEAYAVTCMRRSLIDCLRRQRRRMISLDESPDDGGTTRGEILPAPVIAGTGACFSELTADLSDTQAITLWLRFSRDLSVTQIASLFLVSKNTVKSRIRQALRRLRKKWLQKED